MVIGHKFCSDSIKHQCNSFEAFVIEENKFECKFVELKQ